MYKKMLLSLFLINSSFVLAINVKSTVLGYLLAVGSAIEHTLLDECITRHQNQEGPTSEEEVDDFCTTVAVACTWERRQRSTQFDWESLQHVLDLQCHHFYYGYFTVEEDT